MSNPPTWEVPPTCPTCYKKIIVGEGKYKRKYCSIDCYPSKQLIETSKRKKSGVKPSLDPIPCLNCGKPMQCKPSEIKRGKKTCSRSCYHEYLAKRFDRFIENPINFKQMKNFDEYLSNDKLNCLVEGCDWEGDNLGLHVNLHHGISARDFKMQTGFNLHTSLVSQPMRKNLEARGNKGNLRTLNQPLATSKPRHKYISEERKEHLKKASMLRYENQKPKKS